MLRIILPFVSREAPLRSDRDHKVSAPRFEAPTIPRKLLIVRLSAVGDVVHVLPSLKTLRKNYPSAHIAWLVEDKAEGILRGHPDLDEIIVFPKKRWIAGVKNPFAFLQTVAEFFAFVTNLRRQGFEMALDFHGNLKSGIMTFLTGAPLRVGFARGHCKEGNFLFTNRWIDLPPRRLHRIERNLSLLEGLGLRPIREGATIAVSREDEEYTASNLKVSGKGPLIVIHPGTSTYGAYKRWPATSYAQLGDRLVEEFNARVVFTWGPAELERTKEILSAMRHPGDLAPEAETLGKLASLIRKADLFISGDTGPMNIASILGVPQVAIFGPKDPAIYGPYHKRAIVVRKEIDCSPCTKKTCDNPVCITSITPEEVFGAARALLGGRFPS